MASGIRIFLLRYLLTALFSGLLLAAVTVQADDLVKQTEEPRTRSGRHGQPLQCQQHRPQDRMLFLRIALRATHVVESGPGVTVFGARIEPERGLNGIGELRRNRVRPVHCVPFLPAYRPGELLRMDLIAAEQPVHRSVE